MRGSESPRQEPLIKDHFVDRTGRRRAKDENALKIKAIPVNSGLLSQARTVLRHSREPHRHKISSPINSPSVKPMTAVTMQSRTMRLTLTRRAS
jgi:hypothetical protein